MDISNPNIIVVLTDGMRPRDLSMFGYDVESDKYMKELAGESLLFKNAYSSSGASHISMNSFYSGQFPTTLGFFHQHPRTSDEEIDRLRKNKFWLPIYLQKKGYETSSITAQFLWFKKGFDDANIEQGKGAGKYFNTPWMKRILLGMPGWMYALGKKTIKIRTSVPFTDCKQIVSMAIDKIDKSESPFFMYMQFTDTHCPYGGVKTPSFRGEKTVSKLVEDLENDEQKEYVKKRFFDSDTKSVEQTKDKLDASIKFADEQIGRLVEHLKKKGIWDNTILIVLSDHGENYGEHSNYFCRGGLYDTSLHIPIIMHIPGFEGRVVNDMVSTVDLTATVLDILGDKRDIDGKSLLPLVRGEVIGDFRDKIVSVDGFCKDRISVRTKDRKLIISKDPKCYLCGSAHRIDEVEEYNLIEDPDELRNVYDGRSDLDEFLDKERGKVDGILVEKRVKVEGE